MAQPRPRRSTLRRSVEEAMRQRLSGEPAGEAPRNGELFPQELDAAIDQALSRLGKVSPPSPGGG